MRVGAVLALVLALASRADAAPSFDCAKASNAVEKKICDDSILQWFDRQAARLYNLARKQIGASNRGSLLAEQRDFIARRNACGPRYQYECVVGTYEDRLATLAQHVNVYEAYAKYRSDERQGVLWVVRLGFVAAVNATGEMGEYLCAFEADNAQLGGKGVIRLSPRPSSACHVDIVPEGDDMRIASRNCKDYCGELPSMDGLYGHVPRH